jgi:polyhydroxyalkanoate synthase
MSARRPQHAGEAGQRGSTNHAPSPQGTAPQGTATSPIPTAEAAPDPKVREVSARSGKASAAAAGRAARPTVPVPQGIDDSRAADLAKVAYNLARLMEQGGKALAACLKPIEPGDVGAGMTPTVTDAFRSIGKVAEHWLADPSRTLEAQTALGRELLGLWAHILRRLSGETDAPVVPYDPSDKRFAAPEWRDSPYFDFFRQVHGILTNWAADLVDRSDTLEPQVREKAKFYLRQLSSALSPANFLATNPELIRETWASQGENLVRGAAFLAEDLEAGGGQLKIRRVDSSKFEIGVNLATMPGKVVFRNDLIELIQYAPTTAEVYKRPLLVIPPWINKYYILDLNPEKSFVRYAVAQGLTVFIISWVNPDESHRDKDFENYMREGIFDALEAIEDATGEKKVTAIGYCIGGTLLAMSLAYMAKTKDKRIESASFFTTQTDFSEAGDLKIFVDEDHLKALEQRMAATGYLDASAMANAFNMLRPDDLIWSYVVNNYLKGQAPLAFDLLAWNSDSTRMPARNHLTYLRHCYLENRLARGKAKFGGRILDLSKVTIPVYHLATKDDHIAPARSVFLGARLLGGNVRFVLAGSGHIAGVINPVAKPKYPYWTGGPVTGTFEEWLATTVEHQGSWWADWVEWVTQQSPEKVPARIPGEGGLEPLGDAPGDYVRVRY